MLCISCYEYWVFRYSTRTFGYFKSKGIPGPRPYPMIGTLGTMYGQVSATGTYCYIANVKHQNFLCCLFRVTVADCLHHLV